MYSLNEGSEMIPRLCSTLCSVRNVSRTCHWTLSFKLNSCKLFHTSSTSFEQKIQKENAKVLEESEGQHYKVLKVWKNITPREMCRALNISLRDLGAFAPELNISPDEEIESLKMISPFAHRLGWKVKIIPRPGQVKKEKKRDLPSLLQPPSKPENLVKRPPVVTVMGHVDHGKTTLLDSLRNTSVVQQEFGGITQHIGAFTVEVKPGEKITFIDTPGHAAFTAMRSRGAEVTDLVVLVVAADDGVMEQTLESIKIASQAEVPIIVAVNKIDKPSALPIDDIKEKLLWEGIQVEDKGGDIQLVPISALKKINLDLLQEAILVQAELMDLKGDPTGLVEAVIIESKKGKTGIVATLIIKRGTLKKGKIIVAGKAFAKVRIMVDEDGKQYKEATPSTPVQVMGWRELPAAGDPVFEVESEKHAKTVIQERERKEILVKQESDKEIIEKKGMEHQIKYKELREKMKSFSSGKEKRVFHYELTKKKHQEEKQMDTGPHLKVLLKADVYGSLEVLEEILNSYDKQDECKFSIVDSSIGHVTPKDVEVAASFDALIYAFNVNLLDTAEEAIREKKISIRFHNVLYKLIDDVKEELTLRIPLKDKEEINGEAEVLENFVITNNKKKVNVAGARCIKGQLKKDSLYRISRNNEVIYEGKLLIMKNEKIEVKTIGKGTECGLLFDSFPDKFQPGDKITCYDIVKVKVDSSWDPGF